MPFLALFVALMHTPYGLHALSDHSRRKRESVCACLFFLKSGDAPPVAKIAGEDDNRKGTVDIPRPPRERRWFVLERPRRDTNGGSETEVTVTSKQPSKYRKKQGDRKETENRLRAPKRGE